MKVGDLVMMRSQWAHVAVAGCGIILSVIGIAPGRKNASYEVYWPNSNDCKWHAEPHIRKINESR